MSKTALLTGATSGIGEAAAIALAKKGYQLFLVARNKEKAGKTGEKILAEQPGAQLNWLYGDLARLSDVRSVADEFIAADQPLDLLFNNAGVVSMTRELTHDGFEQMLGVNHLAPFLLTNLLMDKLVEGEQEVRVVTTSSGAHTFIDKMGMDDLNWEQSYKRMAAYGQSKAANILFTRALGERLDQQAAHKSSAVNCFHPGFVGTGLGTQTFYGKVVMGMLKPFARSSAKGAETGVYLATDPSIKDQSGGYYYDCKKGKVRSYTQDRDTAEELWARSLEMTGLA